MSEDQKKESDKPKDKKDTPPVSASDVTNPSETPSDSADSADAADAADAGTSDGAPSAPSETKREESATVVVLQSVLSTQGDHPFNTMVKLRLLASLYERVVAHASYPNPDQDTLGDVLQGDEWEIFDNLGVSGTDLVELLNSIIKEVNPHGA